MQDRAPACGHQRPRSVSFVECTLAGTKSIGIIAGVEGLAKVGVLNDIYYDYYAAQSYVIMVARNGINSMWSYAIGWSQPSHRIRIKGELAFPQQCIAPG